MTAEPECCVEQLTAKMPWLISKIRKTIVDRDAVVRSRRQNEKKRKWLLGRGLFRAVDIK